MREITTQEMIAVVGGVQEVHITRKKNDGSGAGLQSAVRVSGAGGAGASGGGGGSRPVTTVTCVDTIEQFSQTGSGPTKLGFGVRGLDVEMVPKIESVKKTSVCTTVKTNTSR